MTSAMPLDELLRNIRTLATFPPVLAKLNVALKNEESLDSIATIIGVDVDLSARLLRLVNSAFYGMTGEIYSLTHAISMIGIQEVRNLALASNAITMFRGIDADLINVEQFWYHSLGCSIACRVIGRKGNNAEFTLIAGLLHDIGRLAIYIYMPDKAVQILEESRRSKRHQYIIEKELLRYDHGMIGAALLEEWQLPLALTNSVRFHHEPALSPGTMTYTDTVHLANLLAHSMNLGHSGTIFYPDVTEKDWESVGLTSKDSPDIVSQIQSDYDAALSTFSNLL